jgi:hypothetical protein
MNVYFALAGGLTFLLALAHSVLGELLLIRRLSNDGLPSLAPFSLIEAPSMGLVGSPDLARRTLRFSWHLPSVLGAGFGAILLRLAMPAAASIDLSFVEGAVALSILASSLVVLVCSKGKHPGWIAFLAIAILIWLGGNGYDTAQLLSAQG